jgi:Domain of unknown function (DUF4411)
LPGHVWPKHASGIHARGHPQSSLGEGCKKIASGVFAVTTEIYEELEHLPGQIGECIKANKENLILEVEQETWDWPTYLDHVERMRVAYTDVISEYNGNRRNTVCLNDISIIALAKTLGLPVISSEKKLQTAQDSNKRQKIPDICDLENVPHMSFNEFLRNECITN